MSAGAADQQQFVLALQRFLADHASNYGDAEHATSDDKSDADNSRSPSGNADDCASSSIGGVCNGSIVHHGISTTAGNNGGIHYAGNTKDKIGSASTCPVVVSPCASTCPVVVSSRASHDDDDSADDDSDAPADLVDSSDDEDNAPRMPCSAINFVRPK